VTIAIRRPVSLLLAVVFLAACTSSEDRAKAYADAAVKAYAAGDHKTARLEAQNALQVEPKNVPARFVMAQIAEKNGEIGQMLGHLEIVVVQDPKHVEARTKLATILAYSQDYAGAQMLVEEVEKLAPDDPAMRMVRARIRLAKNDVDGAQDDLQFVIGKEPTNNEAVLLKAMSHLLKDEPETTVSELSAAIDQQDLAGAKALRQARIDVLQQLGRVADVERELVALVKDYPADNFAADLARFYVALNRLDDAEAALRTGLEQRPDNADLKFALAQFQTQHRRDPKLAEATLKGFIAESPDDPDLKYLLGTFYEASGRPADALAVYRPVADGDPKSARGLQARNRIAAIAFASGDLTEARAQFESLLADTPDNVDALLGRGEINQREGRLDDAVADYRGAIRKAPDNGQALLLLARAHRQTGDRSLAEDAYRRLLQLEPANREASVEFAQILTAQGQVDDAVALLDRALRDDPKNAVAISALVDARLAKGDLEGAEQQARALVASGNTRGVGQAQLGKVLQRQGNEAAAATAFQAALRENDQLTVALQGLIASWTNLGQLDQAGAFLADWIKARPAAVDAKILLGGNLLRRGQVEPARELLTGIVDADPRNVRAWLVLVGAAPDRPALIELLEKGIAANPGSVDLALMLGSTWEQAGEFDRAIDFYDQFLRKNPGLDPIANNLAALLLDYRKDAASFQRALDLTQKFADSRDPQYLDTLGWANYRKGDAANAVRFLELALANNGDNPVVRYHLGMAYLAADNDVGAKQELTRALQMAERFPGADEARAALKKLGA
jgi:tetratricopeptide (TPR) repeat protein